MLLRQQQCAIQINDSRLCFLFIISFQFRSMFSEKSMTPIDRQLSKKVVKIIHGLLMMEQSAAFRKPVPHKALGLEDYKLIVKKPTDLNLIRRQNNQGKYKFAEQILDEIQLCWDNCKLYNAIGSEIYDQAMYLENAFDKFGFEILPDIWKNINREEYNGKFNEKKLEDQKSKKPEAKGQKKQKPALEIPSEQALKSKPKKTTAGNHMKYFEPEQEFQQLQNQNRQKDSVHPEDIENDNHDIAANSQGNVEKESMDIQQGEDGNQIAVEPILVTLSSRPSKDELLELSNHVKSLYAKQDYGILEKVLEVLHSHEKENMSLNKNGLMTFRMNNIHISTYYRIKKLIGLGEEGINMIE